MLDWLYTAISWVLLRWHQLFSLFMDEASGLTWALSICFLVITIRLLLFPLFVKQYHSMKAMQELSPKVRKLKEKYADDRQAQARAMMELQREAGVNPLGGCLPLLLQAPVFIGLFHVLRRIKPGRDALYSWTPDQMSSAIDAKLFGAPLPATFKSGADFLDPFGASVSGTRTVVVVLLVLSCIATFITQWQNYQRNRENLDPQQAGIQKFLMAIVPFGLAISGLFFGLPLGVLIYWFANNLWTMGQQFYIMTHVSKKHEAKKAAVAPPTKAQAPKPGARPSRDQRGRVVTVDDPETDTDNGVDNGTETGSENGTETGSETTAPPAKPARPQGNPQPAQAGGTAKKKRQPTGGPRPGAKTTAKKAPQNRPNRKKKRR